MKRVAPQHGVTAYVTRRCRCGVCKAIWAKYNRDRYATKKRLAMNVGRA